MALDPSISLAVKTPQVENPLEQAGKALSIVGMRQQQQIGQENLKSHQLANQEALLKRQDDEAISKAWQAAGGDPEKHVQLAAASGARPQAVQALQQHYGSIVEQKAKISDAQAKAQEAQDEQISGAVQGLLQTPDDQYEAAYGQTASRLKQMYPDLPIPTTAPPKEGVAHIGLAYQTNKILDAQATQKRAQAEEQRKQAAEAQNVLMRPVQLQEATSKSAVEQANARAALRQEDVQKLAAASSQGPVALQAALAAIPEERKADYASVTPTTKREDILTLGMKPHEAATAGQAVITAAEQKRHNLSTEAVARVNAAVAQGRLAQEQLVNGMKYGPGTQEYWVKQLQDNPDSIKEMPAEFRSSVGQKFREATGLPLPTALGGTTQTQETAARNALDGIDAIREAIKNPEIQKQIGPIMGRLGNIEQKVGTAVGLSPEAEALAQELRTRMRYFVFQEGKAVLGGKLPQQLMKELEASSANPKMDAGMLRGAIKGAEDNAQSVLDNADKQRFGGKMRTREMRGMGKASLPDGGGQVIDKATAKKFYEAAGNDPVKAQELAKSKNWKVE